MNSDAAKTGTRDITYNLTSVFYHALQSATTCEQYVRDAEQEGDQELIAFFREVYEQERTRADRAKQLLIQNWTER